MDEELFELNTIIGEDDFDESIGEDDEEEDDEEKEEGFEEELDDDEEADSLDPEAE